VPQAGIDDGLAGIRGEALNPGLNQSAGREVLADVGLGVLGILFFNVLVDVALGVGVEGDPGDIVDHLDEAGEFGGGLDLVLSLGEDLPEHALLDAETAQRFDVMDFQFGALERAHDGPRIARRHARIWCFKAGDRIRRPS
jgi:hypothetical protein